MMSVTICKPIYKYTLDKFKTKKFYFHVKSALNLSPCPFRCISDGTQCNKEEKYLKINNELFRKDMWSNVTPKVLSLLNRQLHNKQYHPLQLMKEQIINYFQSKYYCGNGTLFSIHDKISPVVTTAANFDSLLVPLDHPSRKNSDSYYINSEHMLRAHTSAHQEELIKMGYKNFLVVGDVYRRDEIDATHYPVFHQVEGVRLVEERDLCKLSVESHKNAVKGFELGERTNYKQKTHTHDAVKILEKDLKTCLLGLAKELFGPNIEYKWVECYFPFTHPSWELEIYFQGKWLEVLGCGIVEQEILCNAGAESKLGFAFGLGLERLAMILYQIPDIRLFWSNDSGFLKQFVTKDIKSKIIYNPISKHPQCTNDISFWLPLSEEGHCFSKNDFYDLIRSVGGDMVEQVECFDEFYHPKKKLHSQSYRITYRHMERTLTQEEVNKIHREIEISATNNLHVTIR